MINSRLVPRRKSPADSGLTAAEGRGAWRRMLSFVVTSLLIRYSPGCYSLISSISARVCAANRVSTADNLLQITAKTASLREGCRGNMRLSEQCAGDRFPFFLQGRGRGGTAGAVVPAAGVAQVAFDAVQIGVRPGALGVGLLLRALMRQVPVALGFPPQRLRGHAEALGRRLLGERAFIGFEIHLKSPLGTLLVTPAGGRDCRAIDNNRRRPARTRACRSRAGGRENPRYRSCRHNWRRGRSCAPSASRDRSSSRPRCHCTRDNNGGRRALPYAAVRRG